MIVERVVEEFDLTEKPEFRGRKPGILEQRKEKSRDAARSRRGKENYEFYELAKLLPLSTAITSQLDKASIIRLTISYLKLRGFSSQGDPQWTMDRCPGAGKLSQTPGPGVGVVDSFESRQGAHILQAMYGFVFILGCDSRFLYISETVSVYLGLSQVEMAGSSIFDYVHPEDHADVIQHLGLCLMPFRSDGSPRGSSSKEGTPSATPRPCSPTEKGYMMVQGQDKTTNKSFCVRMKSTLTKRGSHIKTTGYRVINIVGTIRTQASCRDSRSGCQNTKGEECSSSDPPTLGFVGMAIALPPPTISELRLELNTFITRMSPDFKVIYCEPVISDLTGLSAEDVSDRLLYDLCHVGDLHSLRRSHLDILNKGQTITDYYRLINRSGSHVWVQTCATTMLNSKNSDDQNILAINFVVSGAAEKTHCAVKWQVTRDVISLMSTTSASPTSVELNEIRENQHSMDASRGTQSHSLNAKSASLKPEHELPELRSPESPTNFTHGSIQLLSPEKDAGIVDIKNKRRKMVSPRKRKKSCDTYDSTTTCKALNLTRNDVRRSSVISETPYARAKASLGTASILGGRDTPTTNAWTLNSDNVVPSLPEDLSIKGTLSKSPNIIQHSSGSFTSVPVHDSNNHKPTSLLDRLNIQSPNPVASPRSAVKDLEAVMNRHLPSHSYQKSTFNVPTFDSTSVHRGFNNPFCSRVPSFHQPSSSSWHSTSPFLQSIYPNRESVIKTNARAQPYFLNGELPSSLLTPPEPHPATPRDDINQFSFGRHESLQYTNVVAKEVALETRDMPARDQCLLIPYKDHFPASCLDHVQSSVYTGAYKELSAFQDIPSFSIPSLMSPTRHIHPAYSHCYPQLTVPITTTASDIYSITPPSSNSPDIGKNISGTNHFEMTICSSRDHISGNISPKLTTSKSSFPASNPAPQISTNHYLFSRHQRDHFFQNVRAGYPAKGSYYGLTAPTASPTITDLNQINSSTSQYGTCTRSTLRWY